MRKNCGRHRTRHFLAAAMSLAIAATACRPSGQSGDVSVLLFAGAGSSPNDVAAIEAILRDEKIGYEVVDSRQLSALSTDRLQAFCLILVPGGNYLAMGQGLKPAAAANVRRAVEAGTHYLGICAGALLAGDVPDNGFNLTRGVRFDFYAAVNQNVHKAAVAIERADGATLEHYWEDGPQLAGWGQVVATYPDGTPAIAQGRCGHGLVLLCGVHPEAPANWREGMAFATPVGECRAHAAALIRAALTGAPLAHF